MLTAVKFAISVLTLAGAGLAQDGLTIDNRHKERLSTPEAGKIYSSAYSVVEWEFDIKHPNHHQVRLLNFIQNP
jgi:DNA-binding transcriptional regulator YiaG